MRFPYLSESVVNDHQNGVRTVYALQLFGQIDRSIIIHIVQPGLLWFGRTGVMLEHSKYGRVYVALMMHSLIATCNKLLSFTTVP